MSDDQGFAEHRGLLFTVAYEMLGSAADAEDVVQETWLRWAGVDHAEVHDARAYLVRITTRLALNRLRTLARRRESYVGPWLPEPLLTVPDVADDVALADSVSTAMLLVLETLAPVERARSMISASTERKAWMLLTTTGKNDSRNTSSTFGIRPKPNQMMNKGAMAIFGMIVKVTMAG